MCFVKHSLVFAEVTCTSTQYLPKLHTVFAKICVDCQKHFYSRKLTDILETQPLAVDSEQPHTSHYTAHTDQWLHHDLLS